MVVSNQVSPTHAENLVKSRLENMGYMVTLKTDATSGPLDAVGQDVVVIPRSVNDLLIGSRFHLVTVPVVVWENNIFDDMKMTSGSGSSTNTQITISNSTHPLAAGLSGIQTVYGSFATLITGTPNANAARIATLSSASTQATIFGYDKDISMIGGTIAPARRVGFLFSETSAQNANSKGWVLFEAAVTWAVTGN